MLKGRNAIVTGSTSGIGLGIARGFAAAGANVVINGFGKPEDIEKERAGLEAEFGITAIYSGADMSKGEQIAAMVAEAEEKLGSVDILVNNAGIQLVSPIDTFPIEKFEQIVAINMVSNFHAIRAALPGMKKRNWGRIINVASAHGLVASPFKSAYVAAKHGVVGMTKTVALEIAEMKITCNAICPGFVRTPLVEAQIADQAKVNNMPVENVIRDIILASQPNKRFVEVSEIAALATFLAGDHALSINGTSISIDGGWTAR
ncbi:3-hydroxybutyrate dehydrogenase [Zavarzinia aquatilis]|uniref:3-hydroxybutyrate dehydrogenase n=1 Tax=Zavarzinia aquatilis TaxID=2211142 RepID=A0A317E2J0_9PROT|nr:3-hydroxybutyrate dehydrogenase [Zavarzinia aquatilis]PWR21307.1 3-hydroxybutyrate dehydrogenase [Zavarzinia aquatilis]